MEKKGAPAGCFSMSGLGRGPAVNVALPPAETGTGTSEATERTCQTPSTGSVMVSVSEFGPVAVVSGEPGPYLAPFGAEATRSRSLSTVLVHESTRVKVAVFVW